MRVCTFAGHRIINEGKICPPVTAALESLIARDDDLLFYTGGMGDFDLLCGRLVRRAKWQHPEKRIRLVLVEPYMKTAINTDRERLFGSSGIAVVSRRHQASSQVAKSFASPLLGSGIFKSEHTR